MSIRIKPYYCPKCQSFKRRYGVTATDEFSINHYCKSCGTECYNTEALLSMMISKKAIELWKWTQERRGQTTSQTAEQPWWKGTKNENNT